MTSRLRGPALILLILFALPFALHSVGRGLSVGDGAEQATRMFVPEALVATGLLYAHMVSGGLLSVLALMQLFTAPRRRWPWFHRGVGRVTVGLALVTGIGGLAYIAGVGTIGGGLMDLGFGLYGVLLIAAAWFTWRAAVARAPSHPDWAARLVVLALGSWLYRVHYGLWEIATGGLYRAEDFSGGFDRVQVFAFYLPYLALLELWLSSRNRGFLARRPIGG
jgi:hypothetical protein